MIPCNGRDTRRAGLHERACVGLLYVVSVTHRYVSRVKFELKSYLELYSGEQIRIKRCCYYSVNK